MPTDPGKLLDPPELQVARVLEVLGVANFEKLLDAAGNTASGPIFFDSINGARSLHKQYFRLTFKF